MSSMLSIFLLAIAGVVTSSDLSAGPSISNASLSGTTISIIGTGFGAGPRPDSIEDLKPNIEKGSGAFSKDGWKNLTGGGSQAAEYSLDNRHSLTKSLKSTFPGSQYDCGYAFDTGSFQPEMYVTWWAYFADAVDDGQWKQLFLTPIMNVSSYPRLAIGTWFNGNIGSVRNMLDEALELAPYNSYGWEYWPDMAPPKTLLQYGFPMEYRIGFRQWARYEFYFKESDVDKPNGTLVVRIHKPGGQAVGNIRNDSGNTMTLSSASPFPGKRYVIFLNYWGNDNGKFHPTIYLDDIYISYGSGARARVELGDRETWESCTQRQIQVPIYWSDGSIKVKYRTGTLGAQKYLYVVDAQGNVNRNGVRLQPGPGSPAGLKLGP